MALKTIIYKLRIALSDTNRNYYETLNVTVAQHPSETVERMMTRVLVYCINMQEGLVFTKGLSAVEQPDIWVRTLDDKTSLWIDVGEPSVDRVKKATQQASDVRVYSFNSKSDVWWTQASKKFDKLAVSIFRFEWRNIQALATLVQRSMDFSVTITGESAYIATELGECEVSWSLLQER